LAHGARSFDHIAQSIETARRGSHHASSRLSMVPGKDMTRAVTSISNIFTARTLGWLAGAHPRHDSSSSPAPAPCAAEPRQCPRPEPTAADATLRDDDPQLQHVRDLPGVYSLGNFVRQTSLVSPGSHRKISSNVTSTSPQDGEFHTWRCPSRRVTTHKLVPQKPRHKNCVPFKTR
jgi:hypothetical protein